MIISKIQEYIKSRNLQPGDKLPSERVLSENFKVSRRNVVEAIEKLESFSLVKSVPKSGTFVAEIGNIALNGIIDDIIILKKENFLSLVETRIMLEEKSVELAAKRRKRKDLKNIETALDNYKSKILSGQDALQEDMLFHLAIAKASKNTTINTLLLKITPNIITTFEKTKVNDEFSITYEVNKHEAIFNAIRDKKPKQAVKAIKSHFEMLIKYCERF
nr:FadR/GntR family transcriptional regulator [Polaribacter sp. Z022]